MQARPIVRRPPGSKQDLPEDMHPLLRRIFSARHVSSPADLDYSLERLHSYESLGGIDRAVDLLSRAISESRRLMIIADYDVDGATACAVGMRALKSMGAPAVEYLVPDRFKHGYGLSPDVVELAAERKPDILITVDNGISSVEGAARAAALGMEVIITDHHLPGAILPKAAAIVDPNLPGDAFPSKALAGVGVMFYVMAALRAKLRALDWFVRTGIAEPNLAVLLDLVALGTVADVVPLDANNRVLVAQGLERIRAGRCVPGITALLRAARRASTAAGASDLGYAVGPRLNAAGRLTDMTVGIECLLADDEFEAQRLARELNALNQERREIQADMQRQALDELANLDPVPGQAPAGLCIFNEDWHAGVVGVLASQLKEQLQRPVVAFAREADGMLKGSGRSIRGVHLRDVLADVSAQEPEVIHRFGGHAMAAGLSLQEDRLPRFRELFESCVTRYMQNLEAPAVLFTDGELTPGDFNLETAAMLRDAGPWGQEFPEPVFDGEFTVVGSRVVGDKHLKLQLEIGGVPRSLDAIAFNLASDEALQDARQIRAAYRLDVNEYNGRRSLQLVIEQAERTG